MKALTSNMKILSCSILFLATGKLNYNRVLTHTTIIEYLRYVAAKSLLNIYVSVQVMADDEFKCYQCAYPLDEYCKDENSLVSEGDAAQRICPPLHGEVNKQCMYSSEGILHLF